MSNTKHQRIPLWKSARAHRLQRGGLGTSFYSLPGFHAVFRSYCLCRREQRSVVLKKRSTALTGLPTWAPAWPRFALLNICSSTADCAIHSSLYSFLLHIRFLNSSSFFGNACLPDLLVPVTYGRHTTTYLHTYIIYTCLFYPTTLKEQNTSLLMRRAYGSAIWYLIPRSPSLTFAQATMFLESLDFQVGRPLPCLLLLLSLQTTKSTRPHLIHKSHSSKQ